MLFYIYITEGGPSFLNVIDRYPVSMQEYTVCVMTCAVLCDLYFVQRKVLHSKPYPGKSREVLATKLTSGTKSKRSYYAEWLISEFYIHYISGLIMDALMCKCH